jgi:hypothetical protein
MHERRMRDGALTIGEQWALPDPSHSHISLFPSHPLPSLPTCATSPVPGGGWISGGASSERAGHCRVRHCLAAPRPTTPPSPSPPPSDAARRSPRPPLRSAVVHAPVPAPELEDGSRGGRRLWCCVATHWFVYSSAPVPLTYRPSPSTVMPLTCSTESRRFPCRFHLLSPFPILLHHRRLAPSPLRKHTAAKLAIGHRRFGTRETPSEQV